MKKILSRLLVTSVLVASLLMPGVRPAHAFGAGGIPPSTSTAIAYWTAATIGIATARLPGLGQPARQSTRGLEPQGAWGLVRGTLLRGLLCPHE